MKTVFLPFILLCLCAGMSDLPAQTTLWQLNGLASWDYFGGSVAGAGDVNWDGFPDFVVGAPGASPRGRASAGQVRVFSGKDGSVLHTFNGLATVNYFGYSVAGAGDVNRDGYADIVVGAPGARHGGRRFVGQVTVFSGKDGSILHTFNGLAANDYFGHSVAGAGDVDRDGIPDIIVGAQWASPGGRWRAGQVRVFSGKDGSVLHNLDGQTTVDWFGCSVAGVGDVNKDGHADFIVGAFGVDMGGSRDSGQATVFSGKDGSVLHTFNGLVAADMLGYSVAGVGDVNRDGFPDFMVGAPLAGPGGRSRAGQATVFSGKDGKVLYTFDGLRGDDWFGYSVAGAGDVDRDGFPDFVVGAVYAHPGRFMNVGQVRIFSGKDGSVLHTFNGVAARDSFGNSVAGAGDVDRDGFPDIVVGAAGASPGGQTEAGQATVFSVATTSISGSGSPRIGGTMNLNLTALRDANLPYHVGSSLGTGPIQTDNRLLNLSPDVLFVHSIQGLFPTIFSNYIGILTNSGQGTAAINIPSAPLLIGLRIYSAFVTLDPNAPSGIKSISNAFSFVIAK